MQLLKFNEKIFDFLVTIFAKHTYTVYVNAGRVAEFELLVDKLHTLGFIIVQSHLSLTDESTYTLQVSTKGRRYITDTEPTMLIRAFIRTRFINYAIYWIQRFLTVGQLPEFLTHEDPDIRKAAYEKYTGNCSELVFPNELNTRAHSGTGLIPALLR